MSFTTAPLPCADSPLSVAGSNTAPSIADSFVLVVGGLGYIGSQTSWELLKAGFNVIIIDDMDKYSRNVLDKLEDSLMHRYPLGASRPIIDFYEADYRDQHTMRAILSKYRDWWQGPSHSASSITMRSAITGVIHFTTHKATPPIDYHTKNVNGMIDFCATLYEFGIKNLIFSSPDSVYGELASQGQERLLENYCDRSFIGLTKQYARTKWMCEAILQDIAESDSQWTITSLRYLNPSQLGEEDAQAAGNVIPVVINDISDESPLSICGTDWHAGDGAAMHDFIDDISDLARGHVAALIANKELENGFKTFNIDTRTGHSVKEIIAIIGRVSGIPIPTKGRAKWECQEMDGRQVF